MKVVFVCTGNTFTPSMLYKENYFIKAAVNKGYETVVFAGKYEYKDGKRTETVIGEKEIDGYKLIRFPYKQYFGSTRISDKIRNVTTLTSKIIEEKPNFVFYNCPQVYNITEIGLIREKIPDVKIIMDFSTKYINSAKNLISKYLLHRGIYRRWLREAEKKVDGITYISPETLDFICKEYKLPQNKMLENGLPAEVINGDEWTKNRNEIREQYEIEDKDILFVHSGKIGILKRTIELLKCFSEVNNANFRMIIAGSLEEDVREEITSLVKQDKRVAYIGFVSGNYLTKLLCASDMYLQPGTISQTSQTAICCGSPIMFMNCPTNEELYNGNGFLLDSLDEMKDVFVAISKKPEQIETMREKSFALANEKLEYKKLFEDTLHFVGLNI